MEQPCYKCPARYIGCHSTCPKYLEWQAWWKEHRPKKSIQTESDARTYRAPEKLIKYNRGRKKR